MDEFNDYGELDMMTQYVQDVRAVQKRLSDVQEQISFINKVSPLYWSKIICPKKLQDF